MKRATSTRVGVVGVDFTSGGPSLQDAAAHHHCHAVRHGERFGLIVGDIDEGGLQATVQFGDFRAHVDAQGGVEVGERLIHQKGGRVAHKGAAKGSALALAARQLAGFALQKGGDLERLGCLADLVHQSLVAGAGNERADDRQALGAGEVAQPERCGHVLGDGQVRVERVGLKDHGEVAIRRTDAGHVLTADDDAPGIGAFEPCKDAQERGFAAAGRANEGDELALGNGQVDTGQDRHIAKGLGDRGKLDLGHGPLFGDVGGDLSDSRFQYCDVI